MDQPKQLDARALGLIAVALLTWSSAYAAIAYALASFTAGEVAFARLALAAACFVVMARVRRARLPPARDWPRLLVLGWIGLGVYHVALNLAETRIASGTAAILIALVPAATAALSALWLHERLPARVWLGLGVALFGVVAVVLTSGRHVRFEPMAAMVLLSVLASAIYFVGQKPLLARHGVLAVTTVTFLAGAIGTLPLAMQFPQALHAAPWRHVAALAYLGVAPTFTGYLAWNAALARARASQVSSFIYFSPPIAVLIGWLWLGERPGWMTLVGGAVIVGGVVMANARRRVAPVPANAVAVVEPGRAKR